MRNGIQSGDSCSAQFTESEGPLREHIEDFLAWMTADGISPNHARAKCNRVNRVLDGLGMRYVRDLDGDRIQQFIFSMNYSKPTRARYASSLRTFARWLTETNRMLRNPLTNLRAAATDIPSALTLHTNGHAHAMRPTWLIEAGVAMDNSMVPVSGEYSSGDGVSLETLLIPVINQFSQMQHHMFEQFQQTIVAIAQTFRSLHLEQAEAFQRELKELREINQKMQTLQLELVKAQLPTAESAQSDKAPSMKSASGFTEKIARSTAAKNGIEDNVHLWISDRLNGLQESKRSCWQRILGYLAGK